MVYTRTVEGKELRLASSGKLYKDVLLLVDQDNGALYRQMDGATFRGGDSRARLTPLPALQTTWGEWKRLHPDTLALRKDSRIRDTLYQRYLADERLGVAGTRNPDARLPGKGLVVGIEEAGRALAVSLEALRRSRLHQTRFGGQPLLVVLLPSGDTARVFSRRVGKRTLSFEPLPGEGELRLRDRETGTLWSASSGRALAGPLAGEQLLPAQHKLSYWFAWAAYHPETRVEP